MATSNAFRHKETICLLLLGAAAGLAAWAQPSVLTGALALLWLLYFVIRCRGRQTQPAVCGAAAAPAVDCGLASGDTPAGAAGEQVAGRAAGTAILFLQIDNLDDVLQGMDEAQRNAMQAESHRLLVGWASRLNGFFRKYAEDTYIGVFAAADLERMISEKFEILDEIRALRFGSYSICSISPSPTKPKLTLR